MKVKSCGCATYQHGPPVHCPKHQKKLQVQEERGLRRLVRDETARLGHELAPFTEYDSYPGKWVSYCLDCNGVAIVYDEPPMDGHDQVALGSKGVLGKDCVPRKRREEGQCRESSASIG